MEYNATAPGVVPPEPPPPAAVTARWGKRKPNSVESSLRVRLFYCFVQVKSSVSHLEGFVNT